jgi:hypothetical protein
MQTHYNTLTPKTKSKPIPIYEAGRRVGSVRGDFFLKTIRGSKHIWRKNPSIGLSLASLQAAKEAGAARACIRDSETGKEYHASFLTIEEKGIHYTFPGWEPQIFLRLEWWTDRPREADPTVYQAALPIA